MRQRVGVFLIKDGEILLILRCKKDRNDYYVVPGGGAEEGESLEETAIREIKEETNLDVILGKYLGTSISLPSATFPREQTNHFFVAKSFSGDLRLGGPEAVVNNPDNHYELKWVPIKDLSTIDLKNGEILPVLLQFLGI